MTMSALNDHASNLAAARPRVIVAVCTHRRNGPLRRLLDALVRNQESLGASVDLGVVISDDNDDGRAAPIADAYHPQFRLGVHYRHVGSGNISTARNTALDEALPRADWIAMTDDDCLPVDDWLRTMIEVQRATGASAVTGPTRLAVEDEAPSWITDQPFLRRGEIDFPDRAAATTAATNNSLIDAAFLRDRPDLRFATELGRVGGEDMVFYRRARAAGLQIHFATAAVVRGIEGPDRTTLSYQLRSWFWLGNTEFVTNWTLGQASRLRWCARSVKHAALALARPLTRLAARKPPEFRFCLALLAHAAGMLIGALGVRLAHH
jgi:succinoglycan biosynthesis protein ExoM